MRPLRRFWRWLLDSLPIYSYRDCCRHWQQGRDAMQTEIGIVRDERGRFTKLPR
mgnify:CR=1 FL=1